MEIIKDILKVEEQKGYEEIESLIEAELYLDQNKGRNRKYSWADER